MKLRNFFIVVMIWLAGATSAHGQFWEKKEWKTWSKPECEKMLSDSPWTRHFENSVYREGPKGIDRGGSGTAGFQGENRAQLEYTVQLRSALPIRQAVICMAKFQNKYDQMAEAQKKEFDERANEYLNQSFANRVVVHVSYKTNLQDIDRFLAQYWQQSNEKVIPASGDLLGPKGERIRPVRFLSQVGGAREFELIFLRELNGANIANENDQQFSIEMPDMPLLILRGLGFSSNRQDIQAAQQGTQKTELRVAISFDLRKMKYQNKLEY
jgi:hypothetical protein